MSDALEELARLLKSSENEHLEFKEAKQAFEFDTLVKYCSALANEGGGNMILGVSDKRPRKVVGSRAFENLERTKAGLVDRLRLRVDATEVAHPDGRVLVFRVPSRPLGVPIAVGGAYWMRAGEDLVPMTSDLLRRIFDETGPDFTAELSPAGFDALDLEAVERFRSMWRRRSGNAALENMTPETLMRDAELVSDSSLTYAALILLGRHSAVSKYLAQAEVVFEYRSSDVSGAAQQRIEYRSGLLLDLDDLWSTVNLRNDLQHFQDGLFVWNIPTFNEVAVREALLNAVSHRDYRLPGSVFVRQFPRRIEITSPGGFLPGITPENILWRQAPRNRRLAEALARCGLVERAGQGANRMFETCILEGKRQPDYSRSDDFEVEVVLNGEVGDARFLRFLEKIGREELARFSTEDLLVLDLVHRDRQMDPRLAQRADNLVEQGIIERLGRGRGVRYILSRRFYQFLGEPGTYTRKKGLDRETNKALLLKHITENASEGCQIKELMQVLPAQSRRQVRLLLEELQRERKVTRIGPTSTSRWYGAY